MLRDLFAQSSDWAVYLVRPPQRTHQIPLTFARKLSGLALRQCIDLGYHRTASRPGATTNPIRLQMQRRAFWTAFTIDCSQSTTLGRPLGVPVHEVNAEVAHSLRFTFVYRLTVER